MSIFAITERESGEEKGQTAEVDVSARDTYAGAQEKILRTVTYRGALSFQYGAVCAFCRECWSLSGFTVFCLKRKDVRK